jgi:hypothetical protein
MSISLAVITANHGHHLVHMKITSLQLVKFVSVANPVWVPSKTAMYTFLFLFQVFLTKKKLPAESVVCLLFFTVGNYIPTAIQAFCLACLHRNRLQNSGKM